MSRAAIPRWVWLWLGLVLVWGFAFVFIKVALTGLAPLQVAFGRSALGALTVGIILLVTRTRLPRSGRVWLHTSIVGLTMQTIPFSLFAWAETHTTSIVAGMANAATPLWTLAFGLLIPPAERVDRNRVFGLVLGTVGVFVLIGAWHGGLGGSLLGALAAVLATAGYGVGITWTRRHLSGLSEPPNSIVGAQLISGSIQLGILVAIFAHTAPTFSPKVIGAILVLGVLGTGLAFPANFRIIREAGTLASASTTYGTPIVSTIAGIAVLGEALTWNEPIGAVILLFGVAFVQGFLRLPTRNSEPVTDP